MLSVVLSPDIEKMHHDSSKISLCIHPPGLNDEAVNYTPLVYVSSTLSPDFAGSISLLYFLLMFSVVLLTDIATTHHASSKISRRDVSRSTSQEPPEPKSHQSPRATRAQEPPEPKSHQSPRAQEPPEPSEFSTCCSTCVITLYQRGAL
jgi:hypothetical protein